MPKFIETARFLSISLPQNGTAAAQREQGPESPAANDSENISIRKFLTRIENNTQK
ncbi:hypothetical protein [Alitabrizicola rongguiensis]|uniref:hypothetical protein n=1 Tax=Alitabrizicola rongguiensis TaxID=2909234 RepID=UPI001F363043|nr:hypothetical protein [Tabrizicola rongguiensis]